MPKSTLLEPYRITRFKVSLHGRGGVFGHLPKTVWLAARLAA